MEIVTQDRGRIAFNRRTLNDLSVAVHIFASRLTLVFGKTYPVMQLAIPHKGWENEHLATFLLSRIAFVATPVKVGDDIGTDVFCTLFEVAKGKKQDVLLPRSSIAVQIKPNRDPVDVASKLDYLGGLEVPYYLGAVDQQQLTLELFSARFLPVFLAWRPHPKGLRLIPVDEFQREYRTTHDNEEGVYKLLCHKVATLDAHDDRAAIAKCAEAIRHDSKAALQAIASRLNKEYVFEIPGGTMEIFAGPGSAETFRHAFFKRLGEAYFNLSFLLDNNHPASDDEMDAFVAIVDELSRAVAVPDQVMKLREGLQNRRKGCHIEGESI